jgi:hypothetical protein
MERILVSRYIVREIQPFRERTCGLWLQGQCATLQANWAGKIILASLLPQKFLQNVVHIAYLNSFQATIQIGGIKRKVQANLRNALSLHTLLMLRRKITIHICTKLGYQP